MPNRRELSLTPIKHLLRHIHMYDVVDGGKDFLTRVMGSGVFVGRNPDTTGKLLSEHPDAAVRSHVGPVLCEMVETAKPARLMRTCQGDDRFHITYAESVCLPLGTGDTVEQIVAMTIFTHELQDTYILLPEFKAASAAKQDIFVLLYRFAKIGGRRALSLIMSSMNRERASG